MTVGLLGSHRSGKTTLARAYAEKWNIPFVETKVSDIFKELGVDPAKLNTIEDRIGIQIEILNRTCQLYQANATFGGFIADRTPLDMCAYTLAEIGNKLLPIETEKLVLKYIASCIIETNKYFSTLLLVQPGLPLVHEEGKAAMSPSYIEHLNTLMLGLMVDSRTTVPHYYIPRGMTDHETRLSALEEAVNRSVGRVEAQLDTGRVTAH